MTFEARSMIADSNLLWKRGNICLWKSADGSPSLASGALSLTIDLSRALSLGHPDIIYVAF
jgi:hypothetical protein